MANVNALQKKLEGEKKGSQKKTSLSSDKNTTNNNVISQDVLDLLNKQQQVQNKNAVNQVVSGNTQQQSQPRARPTSHATISIPVLPAIQCVLISTMRATASRSSTTSTRSCAKVSGQVQKHRSSTRSTMASSISE